MNLVQEPVPSAPADPDRLAVTAASTDANRHIEPLRVAVLTGGGDKPYALGLASSLIAQGIAFDFIGSDEIDSPELRESPLACVLNLRGDQRANVGPVGKATRVLKYYIRLLVYASSDSPKLFHILWNNKFEYLDRTLVLLYYRLWGKRIILTAHNVNIRGRDGNDTWANRVTLKIQYRLAHHIFVHTERMKLELQNDFGVSPSRTSVIPFGLNSTVPDTTLTSAEAKRRLGFSDNEKILLFFGNIAPYKGLEYLIEALRLLASPEHKYRLVIAGRPKGNQQYWESIREKIAVERLTPLISERIEYIPDEDTELYFKGADVLVLPYTQIFQSGVLFLGYNFGLPVIASDVGSLRDDIIEGKTGFICRPKDPVDLARAIRT